MLYHPTIPHHDCRTDPGLPTNWAEGAFHGAMRAGTSICYVSFDFRGGIFNQISSELSQEVQAEMGLTDTGTSLDMDNLDMVWERLTGGLPLTAEEHALMCGPPIRGLKSGGLPPF